MILVEHNGERMLVLSLKGHDGATVIRKGVRRQPSSHHRLDDVGKWVEDADAKEHARLNAMTRRELLEEAARRVNGDSR